VSSIKKLAIPDAPACPALGRDRLPAGRQGAGRQGMEIAECELNGNQIDSFLIVVKLPAHRRGILQHFRKCLNLTEFFSQNPPFSPMHQMS